MSYATCFPLNFSFLTPEAILVIKQLQEVTQESIMFEILAGLLVGSAILLVGAMVQLVFTMKIIAKDVAKTKEVTVKTWDAHNVKDSQGRYTWYNPDQAVLKELRGLNKIASETLVELKMQRAP